MAKKARPASRYDIHGEWSCMGTINNYVMARRLNQFPRVFSRRDWDAMARRRVIDPDAATGCADDALPGKEEDWRGATGQEPTNA